MSSAASGCLFMLFILYTQGVQGQADTICALKGSSVDLPCSAGRSASNMTWYTVHWNGSKFVQNELPADGNHTKYNVSEGTNFTLTITNVTETDAKFYCCIGTSHNPNQCWYYRTELLVADLQVKVIPTSEGQTVTLMCSSSCPLTEKPAAYIWYKNGEFLYQDWSPWYQQLVRSQEEVTYSCAIKGYEHLRVPEVSVDSVTSSCFNVTYAEGRMCSYQQMSEDEPCSITFPREVNIQRTPFDGTYTKLTCNTSCPLIGPQTAFRWFHAKMLYKLSETQHLTIPGREAVCAVKGHEDLLSAEVCANNKRCHRVNYVRRRICALQGSSVNISSKYAFTYHRQRTYKSWYKITIKRGMVDAEKMTEDGGRVEYDDTKKKRHILRIKNLKKSDSAEYKFKIQDVNEDWQNSDLPGVTLIVTGLEVKSSPSAVVTEGQRVSLTCSTSCPLTDNTNYIWYFNSGPLTLPQNQNKVLLLDPVSSQHAGNYSCAVKTQKDNRSPEETLIVQVLETPMEMINAVRLAVMALIPVPLLLFHLWLRCAH